MKKKKFEIDDFELCPCGSGKKYVSCCKKKRFTYKRTKNYELIKEVPISKELMREFQKINNTFEYYYGRKMGDNELIFTGSPKYRNTYTNHLINLLRNSGIEESMIYASYKTGLFPSEENLDLITDNELDEYSKHCDEFENLMSDENTFNGEINSVQFVTLSNYYLSDKIDFFNSSLSYVLNDFITRHKKEEISQNYRINGELDYLIFSSIKAVLTIDGAMKLKEEYMPETIYSLSRGLFENYLYLCNINNESSFFKKQLLPKLDKDNFQFTKYKNGKINYNKVILKKTGEIRTIKDSIYDLTKILCKSEDKEIYDIFYREASRYIHTDILSAEKYFSMYDPYDEINPTYSALLVLFALSFMILEEIINNKEINENFKKDGKHYLIKASDELSCCFDILNLDLQNYNELNHIFLKRIMLMCK